MNQSHGAVCGGWAQAAVRRNWLSSHPFNKKNLMCARQWKPEQCKQRRDSLYRSECPLQYAFPTIYLIIHSGQLPLQGFPCSVWNVRGTDAEAGLPIAGCITAALWRYNSLEEESDTTSHTQLTGNNIISPYSLIHLVLFHPWNTKCTFLTLFST